MQLTSTSHDIPSPNPNLRPRNGNAEKSAPSQRHDDDGDCHGPKGCSNDRNNASERVTMGPNPANGEKCSSSRPSVVSRGSSSKDQCSSITYGEGDTPPDCPPMPRGKSQLVAWKDLPNKKQLAILTLARLSEPLTQTWLQAYMFYQLKSFDHTLPDSTIASQAGILGGSFAAAQTLTAMLWGRAADSTWFGRKRVLLIGLLGTCFSCVGFGFTRSFWQAVVFRVMGGALNGNVGVMRTMISEIIKEKKYPSSLVISLFAE